MGARKKDPLAFETHREASAWLGAFIDGEGCISIKQDNRGARPLYTLTLHFNQCCKELLVAAAQRFGGNVTGPYRHHEGGNHRPFYSLQYSSRIAASLLQRALPFLIEKHEQAKVAIEFVTLPRASSGRYTEKVMRDAQRLRGELMCLKRS